MYTPAVLHTDAISEAFFLKPTEFLSSRTWKRRVCDAWFPCSFQNVRCKISSVDRPLFHDLRKTLNTLEFKRSPGQGLVPFCHRSGLPLAHGPLPRPSQVAPVAGGPSTDTPRGGRHRPPTGSGQRGPHTVTPSACTGAGAFRPETCCTRRASGTFVKRPSVRRSLGIGAGRCRASQGSSQSPGPPFQRFLTWGGLVHTVPFWLSSRRCYFLR